MIPEQGFIQRPFPFLILVVMVMLFIPAAVSAGDKPGPVELAPREWGSYRSHLPDSSDVRWTASWVLERVEAGPPAKYIVATNCGAGLAAMIWNRPGSPRLSLTSTGAGL